LWLQAEHDKLQLLHEASVKDAENDLAIKLHALREELDAKWENIMKSVVFILIYLFYK